MIKNKNQYYAYQTIRGNFKVSYTKNFFMSVWFDVKYLFICVLGVDRFRRTYPDHNINVAFRIDHGHLEYISKSGNKLKFKRKMKTYSLKTLILRYKPHIYIYSTKLYTRSLIRACACFATRISWGKYHLVYINISFLL